MMNVFGWGRRYAINLSGFTDTNYRMISICPGRHLADANTWLLIARILATFTITKAKDADGKPIEPILKCETGLVRLVRSQFRSERQLTRLLLKVPRTLRI